MNIKKFDEIIGALDNLDDAFKQVTGTMSNGPASFYFERMKDYYKGCMKASKYKVGNRVKLKETITDGWQGRNHFMTKGAKATIKEVDYRDGSYCYYIMFDKETWLKDWGDEFRKLKKPIEIPIEDKHKFLFYQKQLEKL